MKVTSPSGTPSASKFPLTYNSTPKGVGKVTSQQPFTFTALTKDCLDRPNNPFPLISRVTRSQWYPSPTAKNYPHGDIHKLINNLTLNTARHPKVPNPPPRSPALHLHLHIPARSLPCFPGPEQELVRLIYPSLDVEAWNWKENKKEDSENTWNWKWTRERNIREIDFVDV